MTETCTEGAAVADASYDREGFLRVSCAVFAVR